MARTLAGLYPDRLSAEHAMAALQRAGFDPEQMGLVLREEPLPKPPAAERAVKSTTGAVAGSAIGGTSGAAVAAIISAFIPGVGPVIAGGILAAALTGGAIGWLIGGLANLGIPIEEADYYQERVEQGQTLLTLNAAGREEEARQIMRQYGAEEFQKPGSGANTPPSPSSSDTPPAQ